MARSKSNANKNTDKNLSESERKESFLQELFKSLGRVLSACQKTGVSRDEYEHWKRDDPDFARRVDQIGEDALDYVESKLFEGIKSGDARLIRFYLETKGRARGYGKDPALNKSASPPTVVLTQDEMEY
ncbi:MAG: hypothetical protein IKX88_11220 [Thermoguttaceae bacterium]|nr:hypothetical protein [Thermoguttaceae bacterium]